MAAIHSKKNLLSCRVSKETYEKVKALTDGEDKPFESISEYLTAIINQDLARREMNVDLITYQFLELLKKDEIGEEVKRLLKESP